MKDRYHKKANVLGIDVSVMRVDKAVNVSMELMRGKGLPVICFLSAVSSLLCQNDTGAAEYVTSCNLILPGDRHIEMAVHHQQENGEIPEGIGEFADNYLKRLFAKLNREGRSIYTIMEQEAYLESLEEYMEESYRNIEMQGTVMRKETKGEADRIVNEINACIPDIVFVCLPAERQIKFMEKHAAMMNARLCILIESVQPLIRKETEEIPGWVQRLHLEGIYSWFKREQKIRNTIVGSVFKKKVMNEVSEEVSEKNADEISQENISDEFSEPNIGHIGQNIGRNGEASSEKNILDEFSEQSTEQSLEHISRENILDGQEEIHNTTEKNSNNNKMQE